jgi:hypothetical protein
MPGDIPVGAEHPARLEIGRYGALGLRISLGDGSTVLLWVGALSRQEFVRLT